MSEKGKRLNSMVRASPFGPGDPGSSTGHVCQALQLSKTPALKRSTVDDVEQLVVCTIQISFNETSLLIFDNGAPILHLLNALANSVSV